MIPRSDLLMGAFRAVRSSVTFAQSEANVLFRDEKRHRNTRRYYSIAATLGRGVKMSRPLASFIRPILVRELVTDSLRPISSRLCRGRVSLLPHRLDLLSFRWL